MVPGNPDSFTFWSSRWPSLAGLRETPRTAIVRGAKIGSSPAITPADGPRLANPAISPLASCPRRALGSQIHHPHGLALGPLDLAAQAIEPQHRPPAVTRRARDDAREVVGAIAHQRQSLTGERRDDQLALGAVGQDTARGGVDDLDVVMVLPDVDAGAGGAVDAKAGAARLGHPDDVEGADGKLLLDPDAQLVRPHLEAEDPHPQRERAEVEALFAGDLEQPQRVRGDGGQHGRAQVTHQL